MIMRRTKSTWSKEALKRLADRVNASADTRENYELKQKIRLTKMKDTLKRY